jgi:tetratricopeptide (TPR) repeat protein
MNIAHAVFQQINDDSRTAQVLGNMARVYAKMGNTEQAITYYREASALFNELGDEENYGQTVLAIADLQMRSGNIMQAGAMFEVGLDYVEKPNARQRVLKRLLGVPYRMLGLAPLGTSPASEDEAEAESGAESEPKDDAAS